MNVRRLAVECLYRIVHRHCKADKALADVVSAHVAAADRRWLHEVTLGVLRRYFSLQADASRFLVKRPDGWPCLALLLGVYQLRHMRVAEHAAVSETVRAVKSSRYRYAAGMVNAVLRRCIAAGPPQSLQPHERTELPIWLDRRWRAAFGNAQVEAFMAHCLNPPPLCLAILRGSREQWLEVTVAKGIGARPGMLSDRAVLLPAATDVAALPGYREGAFVVMDQAAQVAADALAIKDGDVIVDACAAPGGKAALVASSMTQGMLLAVEIRGARLPMLLQNIQRLGSERIRPLQADAAELPLRDGTVGGVLVDAPCSASGLLRRHPDAKFLHSAKDVVRHAELQRRLLSEAVRVTRPGGRIVYSVCSLHREEGEAVIDSILEQDAARPAPLPDGLKPFDTGEGMARLFPAADHDGFFIACLHKI